MLNQTQYSADDVVKQGQEIYERAIRSKVEPANIGKFIVIDIHSGDYALGDEYLPLTDNLLHTHPQARLCILRIGYPAAIRIGGRLGPVSS